jgi:hypothetical protein
MCWLPLSLPDIKTAAEKQRLRIRREQAAPKLAAPPNIMMSTIPRKFVSCPTIIAALSDGPATRASQSLKRCEILLLDNWSHFTDTIGVGRA